MSIEKVSFNPLTGLFAALLLVGCAGEESTPNEAALPDEELETDEEGASGSDDERETDDDYAQCSKGEVEADITTSLALAGPGVDPDTGMLTPGDYLVATTYLALQPGKVDTVVELSGPVIESSFTLPGFVAMTIAGSEACNTLRTLTVWESEQAMFAFVASPSHTRAMAQTGNISRGTSNTITWEGDADSVTWQKAARELGLEADGDL